MLHTVTIEPNRRRHLKLAQFDLARWRIRRSNIVAKEYKVSLLGGQTSIIQNYPAYQEILNIPRFTSYKTVFSRPYIRIRHNQGTNHKTLKTE